MNSNFVTIEDESEILQAQNLFLKLMKNHATEYKQFSIYLPGPIHDKFEIFWFQEYDFWYGYKIIEEKIKKHRNVFGKGKLIKIKYGNPNISDFQINFPIVGYVKRLGGVFVKDNENNVFVAYNGRIGGLGDYGIGSKENEIKFKKNTSFSIIKESKGRKLFLISKLDETLVRNFAKLTDEIYLIKSKTNITDQRHTSEKNILNNLESKGLSKTHIQILKKFLIFEGQKITDSTKLRGVKGISKIPPDSIVSEPHYMHNLVRGVYKPEGDEYALSIQMNPKSIWGSEIDFETGKWKINYDFGEEGNYSSDISSLKKCFESEIPIGVIYKPEKGINQILGLGKITSIDGVKFMITPYEIDDKISLVETLASTYANDEIVHGDFSAQGSESTVYVRAKQGKFKEILLQEYDGKCVFCGFNDEDYLTGAHIVPYSIMRKEDVKNAMHPSDGILLCKLCDTAFENGDISIDENYEIHITEKLETSTNTAVTSWLSKINNKISINKNSRYNPDPKYLKWKLKLISS